MNDLQVQRPRLEITRKNFLHKDAKVWNDIPNNIRNVQSAALFKNCWGYESSMFKAVQSDGYPQKRKPVIMRRMHVWVCGRNVGGESSRNANKDLQRNKEILTHGDRFLGC